MELELRRFNTEHLTCFRLFDLDHNGKITVQELEELLLQVSNGILEVHEIDRLLESISISEDGTIDFREFSSKLFPKIVKKMERIDVSVLEAFRIFDIDRNGLISPNEFKTTLTRLIGGEMDDEEIEKMMEEADADHDGMINIDELKKKIFPLVEKRIKNIDDAIIESFRLFGTNQ